MSVHNRSTHFNDKGEVAQTMLWSLIMTDLQLFFLVLTYFQLSLSKEEWQRVMTVSLPTSISQL
jgi:heme/copper-type cytochrome/quinol oxidase subunit 3